MVRFALLVLAVEGLGDDAVEARALEVLEPLGGGVAVGGGRREVDRRLGLLERRLETGPALAERLAAQVVSPSASRSNATNAGGRLLGEHRDARLRRVDAQREAVEVEPVLGGDHHLAVDDAALGQVGLQRLEQIGEVAGERLLVAAADLDARRRRGTRWRGSRPTSARRGGRRACRRSTAARAPTWRASARPAGDRERHGQSAAQYDRATIATRPGSSSDSGSEPSARSEAAHGHPAAASSASPSAPTVSHAMRAQPGAGGFARVVERGRRRRCARRDVRWPRRAARPAGGRARRRTAATTPSSATGAFVAAAVMRRTSVATPSARSRGPTSSRTGTPLSSQSVARRPIDTSARRRAARARPRRAARR